MTQEKTNSSSPGSGVDLELEADRRVNYALQQNAIPLIKAVRIHNPTERHLTDLTLSIKVEPECSAVWKAHLASVPHGSTYNLNSVNLSLLPERLRNQTEREHAVIQVRLTASEELLAATEQPLELLAWNEWSGSETLPEILAAFVTPNNTAVEEILRVTRTHLHRMTGDPSLNGYQSRDPRKVLMMAAAVYSAIQDHDISYVNPPASFEKNGQKIRTPDVILRSRMGTCLDLTLLMAACLEQIGLYPLILLFQGHAFPGVWLQERNFAEPAGDDLVRFRKRREIDEIAVFNSSTMVAVPRQSFDSARRIANEWLAGESPFVFGVDIKAAREVRILPLPTRQSTAAALTDTVRDIEQPAVGNAPSTEGMFLTTADTPQQPATAQPETRIDRWKSRLFDLSLRNRLLNFKPNKKTVRIECPTLAELEDMLATGREFRISPRPERLGTDDPRDRRTLDDAAGGDVRAEFLRAELQAGRLYTSQSQQETGRNLTELFREARNSLEESGANMLYLAVGFVAWYESDTSGQRRLAPIILLPVELKRGAVNEGFRLHLIDEEARINITFLQKLQRDFGKDISGLSELPEDQSGKDIPLILRRFRQAVLEMDRWEVVEEAHLGLFSFTKYLMWLDLEQRSEALKVNPVVRKLFDCSEVSGDLLEPLPEPGSVDRMLDPADLFCVLDADSSQLAAVLAAQQGRSFVIEGPPGTGKSQTIANLIAHSLALGRTVLFVSEKRAALEVVHQRLKKTGLAPYCLELHSNKANRQAVLNQLGDGLDAAGNADEGQWQEQARQLQQLRDDLNGYVQTLHRPRESGESAYQVTTRLIALENVPELIHDFDDKTPVTRERVAGWREAAARLEAAAEPIGIPSEHPWFGSGWTSWQPVPARQAIDAAGQLDQAARMLEAEARGIGAATSLTADFASEEQLFLLDEAGGALAGRPVVCPQLLSPQLDWNRTSGSIDTICESGRRRNEILTALNSRYTEGFFTLDLPVLHARFKRWSQPSPIMAIIAWFVLLWSRLQMRKVTKSGRLPASGEVLSDLTLALEARSEESTIAALSPKVAEQLDPLWEGVDSDWDAITDEKKRAERFRSAVTRVAGPGGWGREVANSLNARGMQRRGCIDDKMGPEFETILERYSEALVNYRECKTRAVSLLLLDEHDAWGGPRAESHLNAVRSRVALWRENATSLREWSAYQSAAIQAESVGLGFLVRAHRDGSVPGAKLCETFEKSYALWWIGSETGNDRHLREFHSIEQNRKIQLFKQTDERLLAYAKGVVAARLASRVPHAANAPGSSELGILQRERQKKQSRLSIRKLIERTGTILPRIKPCFLMSPLSIAQYLAPDLPPFDLVIFDEASQIPPWDAIGAIGRGRQTIIVGDSRQLPPTRFFQKEEGEFETPPSEDDIEELESILNECVASQLPRHWLAWHYRSRHESLIAFSNHHYYENRLLTFPSPTDNTKEYGVSLRRVSGTYDRSKSRTNPREAEAVVREIVDRLENGRECRRSIGVVTFSTAQQTLIENLLDRERQLHPSIEPYFGDGVAEPVFIKNLENVQGDERDVMLFSICYGPDEQGRVSMNFGPLNQKGGERRLNVAVTRAREQLIVFSTLRADQINLSHTQAEGARHLKTFLDYAERGTRAIAEAIRLSEQQQTESPFEEAVCRALSEQGYLVDRQVGCSGYRIDLAVKDRDRPGRYLLGIECDGASYHSARSARDRDRLRQSVLERLGWRIHRIWSTDWWQNPEKELRNLVNKLELLQREPVIDAAPMTNLLSPQSSTTGEDRSGATNEGSAGFRSERPSLERSSPNRDHLVSPAVPEQPPGTVPYIVASLGTPYRQEEFDKPGAIRIIQGYFATLVDTEGPVHLDAACRRISDQFGFSRIGSKIRSRILESFRRMPDATRPVCRGEILWKSGQDHLKWRGFRIPGLDGSGMRPISAIPEEELANAAEALLLQFGSMSVDDLARAVVRLFGTMQLGGNVRRMVERAIEMLVQQGRCEIESGMVRSSSS